MKFFYDIFPVLLFFIAYKFAGIYVATGVAMAASALQIAIQWIKYRKLEWMAVMTCLIILIFGGATLIFHDAIFIKWKPTVIYWLFAVVFMFSQCLGKPLIRKMLQQNIILPDYAWQKLNISWTLFFLVIGGCNLYIAYHFSTNTWVNFKVYGLLGCTIIFIVAQAFYLARFVPKENR